MSRRDDDRDEPLVHEPRGTSPVVLFLLLGGGIFLVLVVGGGFALFYTRQSARVEAVQVAVVAEENARKKADALKAKDPAEKNAVKPAPISREEFRDKVIGKTPGEVLKAVGKPDDTADLGGR